MNHRDTMRDPRYAGILLVIERQLTASDRLAATRGLTLTDSNIRSLLVRAFNEAKGKAAKADASASSDKDRFLAEAQRELTAVRATIIEERDQPDGSVERRPLPAAEWLAALEAIKDFRFASPMRTTWNVTRRKTAITSARPTISSVRNARLGPASG